MNWANSTRASVILAVGTSSLTVFAAADLWPGAAWAQESVNIQSESEASSVQEVVVTAERRSESLKSVPISVQAFTAEQLERQAVSDTRDLASISPTINFTTANSANGTSFSLRGVSSIALQNGIQPSTAMVVDGVALAKQAEFVANLSDIDRIEVLNGPQGTLFGKNSTAGVINIVTKGPVDIFAATSEARVTDDDEVSVRGMVNVPLSRAVRVRLTGFYLNQDPQVKNLTGPDVAGSRSYGANAKIAFDLSDKMTLLLSGTTAHSNSTYGQLMALGPSAFGAAQLALAHVPFARGATVINTDAPVYDPTTTDAVTATLNWNLADNLSLVSISNYTHFTENSSLDVDFTPAGAANGRGQSLPGNTYPVQSVTAPNRFPFKFSYYSQEFRLNHQSGPVNTIVGAYYQHYQDRYSYRAPFNFDGVALGGAANGFTPGVRYFNSPEPSAALADRTASLFGDVTYALTEQFKFFAGLRETNEKIDVDYHRQSFTSPADLYSLYDPVTGVYSGPVTSTLHTVASKTTHNLSGRAGVQFIPTQDLNFYASFARGYKGPAADVGQTLKAGANPILKPEIATAYEIGGKLRLLDHRLAINAAVFHEAIDGIQEAVAQPGVGNAAVSLVNAGKLTTRGFEGDVQFAVTPSIRLSSGLAYVKATYADFLFTCSFTQTSTGTCPNTGGPGRQNITGDPAIGVPRWKYSLGADYEHAVGGSDRSLFGLVNYTWNSAIQSQLDNDPLSLEPSHGMLNAGIGLKGKDDRWEVQLFGKNLTNEVYYGQLRAVSIIARPYGYLPRDFHRYVGLKIVNRF